MGGRRTCDFDGSPASPSLSHPVSAGPGVSSPLALGRGEGGLAETESAPSTERERHEDRNIQEEMLRFRHAAQRRAAIVRLWTAIAPTLRHPDLCAALGWGFVTLGRDVRTGPGFQNPGRVEWVV